MNTREAVRKLYPHIDKGFVHLNHAGVSPLNTNAIADMQDFHVRQSEDPSGVFPWVMEKWQECRGRLAGLMGVPTDDMAFTKNTSHGISIIADGLDWNPGDEVIFADCEFPANTYPWLAQARDREVVCKLVKTRPDGSLTLNDFAAQMTSKTRVIAISWVQFSTGFRIDLKPLTELAHSKGVLIVVDVIQGLGGFPINLAEIGVDAAATGSQKWLLGPMGVGGLYIKPSMLERLRLVNMGSFSVKNVQAFASLDLDVKPNAQRYEEGTPNICGFFGLNACLKLVDDFGIENAAKNILEVNSYAAELLSKREYIVDSILTESAQSGILMFHHPNIPSEQLAKELGAKKINVVMRGGKVRFAPHLYTTLEDMDRAVGALP